ncbi:MAG TPA: UDP-glucose/GDP-mannose dehydrogenase family protein [Candidatus Hydrogenedentes bacterium]|nr:UDP-glucose/GDP-mannose dehydrogenase family protein [Candidatus Hydrogenedentota bacterium]
MRIAVIGTGYVGLVTGTCFSEVGHDVTCVDIDAAKIEALRFGRIPIYEPGLDEMVALNVEQGRLSFTTDLKAAIERALFIFIAVGTPPMEDGTADLKHVLAAAGSIGEYINGYKIVVNKSTVPVGTADKVRNTIEAKLRERAMRLDFDVVSNPEFLREGCAIDDFMNPDRIVIGCSDCRTEVLMKELYASFIRDGHPVLTMDPMSSEMTKYAANAMLAMKISFINEVATICERVGANVEDVRNGIGADSRIGYQFIFPGIGYGGSCFPKDVQALVSTAKGAGYEPKILNAVEDVNNEQKSSLLRKLMAYYNHDVAGKRFAIWGLSFKPETDDVREAPSLVLIDALLKAGAEVQVYDPKATRETQRYLGPREGITYAEDSYSALQGCDAMLLVTEWSYFKNPDFDRMKALLNSPVIFDGRNVYSTELMKTLGYDYYSIGRPPVLAHSQAWASRVKAAV